MKMTANKLINEAVEAPGAHTARWLCRRRYVSKHLEVLFYLLKVLYEQ
jgi:hypothetical protein